MTAASKITVIGERLAKPGNTFFFLKEQEECQKCKIKGTCLNLDPGRKYQIISVRNNTLLNCSLHDGGVLAVNVKNAPIDAYIDSKKAIVGSKISYEPIQNGRNGPDQSDDADLFNPKGLEKGDKCVVKEIFESIEKDGKTYKRVSLVLE
jgi:Uncharacterized protein conserved in archaea